MIRDYNHNTDGYNDAIGYFRFNNTQPKDNTDMQSATRTAIENVRRGQQLNEQEQRAKAILLYWMYYGDSEQMLVASYVKQLEDKIKALQGIASDE